MEIFHNDWAPLLTPELAKPYYRQLRQFLINEYRTRTVYPDMYAIFNALHYTSYEDTKVVILGQDPYHGPGQAHGLSFSVLPGVPAPPSLQNIFRELHDDLGCFIPNNGCLKPWAEQGVLLLNTVLTVRAHQANSHRGQGWEQFTDHIIEDAGAAQEGDDHEPAALRRRVAASEPALSAARLLRQPSFLPCQRLPPADRPDANRLADSEYLKPHDAGYCLFCKVWNRMQKMLA